MQQKTNNIYFTDESVNKARVIIAYIYIIYYIVCPVTDTDEQPHTL